MFPASIMGNHTPEIEQVSILLNVMSEGSFTGDILVIPSYRVAYTNQIESTQTSDRSL
jgi:hypothetical protein